MTLSCISAPDPFKLDDSFDRVYTHRVTNGRALRSAVINPALKTLVLISHGQSNRTNINPTLYTPTSPAVIDNFNIYDGALYDPTGPLIGTQLSTQGPGNLMYRVAQNLITAAKYDRVILVPLAVGNTSMAQWTSGSYADRLPCAMRRLASRGITPATPGAFFAIEMGIGETDNQNGTTQSAYAALLTSFFSNSAAAGFSGKTYISHCTYTSGVTSSAIRAANVAAVNGTTIILGGDGDSVTAAGRQADNVHYNDSGAASVATLISNTIT